MTPAPAAAGANIKSAVRPDLPAHRTEYPTVSAWSGNMFDDLIRKRRSIRRFRDQPVEPEKVDRLMEAGLRAPSSRSLNPWEFVVVDDRDDVTTHVGVKLGGYGPDLARKLYNLVGEFFILVNIPRVPSEPMKRSIASIFSLQK